MAKQSIHTMKFNYSPDVVFQVLTSPEFHEANLKAQGNPAATVKVTQDTAEKKVLQADVTEYAKGITGVDKSKTEQTTTTWEWKVPDKTATWTYQSPHSQVKVSGAIQISGSGDSTDLREEFNVDVKVPLMGGKIEKMVLKEVESFWPRYEKLVKEHCEKQAG